MSKITIEQYCNYLYVSQKNYTITNFADHAEEISHDQINRKLKEVKLSGRAMWERGKEDVIDCEDGFLLFDDTVLNKDHSKEIECVRFQYSGNAGKVIRGIGVVSCIYVNPDLDQYWIIDYRIFDPDRDGLTKMDHVSEMLKNVKYSKKLQFQWVLMDTWYASKDLMMQIDRMGKFFMCPIRSNRLVDESNASAPYKAVKDLQWNEQEQRRGKIVKIKGFPGDYKVNLFRVLSSNTRTDYIVTNNAARYSTAGVQNVFSWRWNIEEFHREVKQLTGIEKCQCRLGRIQRNHIHCAILVWMQMKKTARQAGLTAYNLKDGLMKDYLKFWLKNMVFA